ncbi:hypothetical protein AGMMS50230_10920 [Spirochaetia bacterium]|nr:hypothetical protein AGMMS50230_10920 [Spirochaetia bacterium]
MINKLELINFKSFLNASLEIKPLTVLGGLNSSGKSTVIQAINMILSYYKNQKQSVALPDHVSPRLQKSKSSKDNYFMISMQSDSFGVIDLRVNIDVESYTFTGSIQEAKIPNFQYISADRLGPQNILELNPEYKTVEIGTKGEYIIDYIDKNRNMNINEKLIRDSKEDPRLLENINAWLQYISPGILLDYEIKRDRNASYPNYNNIYPTETGFGLSYTLPMIAALLVPVQENDSILLIENPEGHLHPKGQAAMGELIALTVSTGKQVILETHSDHIINSIRVSVRESKININKEDVILFFCNRERNDSGHYTTAIPIEIDENGTLSGYPDNFLDEWSNQLSRLI